MKDYKRWSFDTYGGMPWWYWWKNDIRKYFEELFEIREDREIAKYEAQRNHDLSVALETGDYTRWHDAAMSGMGLYSRYTGLPWFPTRVVLHCLERLGMRSK